MGWGCQKDARITGLHQCVRGTERQQRRLWDYRNPNRRSGGPLPLTVQGAHFATFPEALIEPCILAGAPPGGIVLDPFMGSGTTAAVAKKHGRQYLGVS